MSINNEINRLNTSKISITQAIRAKGVEVPEDAKIDALASYVSMIGNNEGYPFAFSGNPVVATETIPDQSFVSFKVFGKSVLNGTPSINNPVPIVSAGENEEILIAVTGANIFDISKVDTEVLTGYNISNVKIIDSEISFDVEQDAASCYLGDLLYDDSTTAYPGMMQLSAAIFPNQPYTISVFSDGLTSNYVQVLNSNNKAAPPAGWDGLYMNFSKSCTFTSPENASKVIFRLGPPQTGVVAGERFEAKIVISPLEKNTDYTPFMQQTFTFTTSGGLLGVPVASGGNCIDTSGQAYISDYFDFGEGLQHILCGKIENYDGEEITTPYISNTGELNNGSQVIYVLPNPKTQLIPYESMVKYGILTSYENATVISTIEPVAKMEAKLYCDIANTFKNQQEEIANINDIVNLLLGI